MSITRKALIGVAGAATFVLMAGASLAQPPQFGPQGGPPGRPGPDRGAPPDPAQRADNLRTELRVSGAQENAFQAYLTATTPQGPQARGGQRREMRNMTTIQRLDAQLAEAAERQTDLRARVDATKKFYATLTADQRTAFDALPPQAVLGMGPPPGGPGRMAQNGGPGGRGDGQGRAQRRGGQGLPNPYDNPQ